MKSISTINAAITENTKCLIVKAHALFIDLKVGVSLTYGALFRFLLLKHVKQHSKRRITQ